MSQVTVPSPPTSPLNFWVTFASVSFAPGPSSVTVSSFQLAISKLPLAVLFNWDTSSSCRTGTSCAARRLGLKVPAAVLRGVPDEVVRPIGRQALREVRRRERAHRRPDVLLY